MNEIASELVANFTRAAHSKKALTASASRKGIIEIASRTPLVTLESDRLDRFESYISEFRGVFHRSDQFLRFRAYLRGLLEPTERKNVESIAQAASRVMMVEADLPQALQHFVSHSPWDSNKLLGAIRKFTLESRSDPHTIWVVHDGVFPKRGRHSVGVQRQFARALGRKINCQLGVFVSQTGPGGFFPLAARLYLPAFWVRENKESTEQDVRDESDRIATKTEIAIQLLNELRRDGGIANHIAAESGYLSVSEFTEGLNCLGVTSPSIANDVVAEVLDGFEWLKVALGLDHFEGRSWRGWHHHVSLVFAAYGFLYREGLLSKK